MRIAANCLYGDNLDLEMWTEDESTLFSKTTFAIEWTKFGGSFARRNLVGNGGGDTTLRDVKDGPIVAKHSYVFVGTYSEYGKAGSYYQRLSSR